MHALLLTVLTLGTPAAWQQGSAHAKWHPIDAGLYVELPEAGRLCETYDQAPLLRLLNDGEIQRLLKAIDPDGDTTVSVTKLMVWAGEAMDLEIPTAELRAGLTALSLSLRYAEEEWGMTAVMETSTEALASDLAQRFKSMATQVEAQASTGFVTLGGNNYPVPMWLSSQGNRIAMGVSEATAVSYAERSKGQGKSLAESPAFHRGLAEIRGGKGAPVLVASYTGSFPLREGLPEGSIFDALADALSTPMMLSTRFAGQRFDTRMFGGTSASSEGDVFGHLPLKKEWLADLPDDAMLSYATTVDGAGIASLVKSWIDGTPELAGLVDGFDLHAALDELMAPLGPRLLLSMQPIMGLGFPPTYVWVDTTDAAGFTKNFEALAAKLGEEVPGVGARTRNYRVKNKETGEKTTIPYTSLTFPAELAGELGMFAPKLTFAQLDGRVLFSTSSTALKGELKRIYGGTQRDSRDFLAKTGLELTDGARSVTVFDWGVLLGKLVGIAKVAGPMVGDMLPFDLELLPSPAVFDRYLDPTIHIGLQTERGVLREHRSSFGIVPWAAAFATLALRGVESRAAVGGALPPERKASDAALTEAELGATRFAFREIKAGITIYKIETNELPASLQVLTVPTEDYPQGYLTNLPKDAWGHDFRYAKEASGYRLWSVGPNGRDEGGKGDDVLP